MVLKGRSLDRLIRLWLLENLVNFLGNGMVEIAILWTLIIITDNPTYVGLYIILKTLTGLVFTPIAGVMADRFSRKKIIIISNLFRALTQIITAVIILVFPSFTIAGLLIGILCVTAGSNFFFPAVSSLIKDIIPREKFLQASAYRGACLQGGYLVGASLSGFLLNLFAFPIILIIDACTYIVSIFIFLSFPEDREIKNEQHSISVQFTLFKDIKEGLTYLRTNKKVYTFLLIGLGPGLGMVVINTFLSYYVHSQLKLTSTHFGIIEGAYAIGAIFAGVLIGNIQKRLNSFNLATTSLLLFPILFFVMFFPINFYVLFITFIVFGVVVMVQNSSFQTIITESTDGSFLGRVLSFNYFVTSAIFPLITLLIGLIVPKVLSVNILFLCTGIFLLIVSILGVLYIQSLKRNISNQIEPFKEGI
ncbi:MULTISPECIES: MFS transporter [Geobacillus]|uniref:Membrane transporter protein n=1 Tax=Geobacillus stearothermophilus TaxID=1422 RepID=A0A916KNJ8_GEOSE|nr:MULTISPECIES: MFS transporter [Geobacillus]KZM56295.1 hypothetical protein A3Q36_06025 [Geobacillus stearothermophilus]TWG24951.1 putative MFS family arabinose efflux permease [Geobacillus sp. C56-T2]CAP08238.1 putative membrane transporter protein [Geobacillus stearothermophilus]